MAMEVTMFSTWIAVKMRGSMLLAAPQPSSRGFAAMQQGHKGVMTPVLGAFECQTCEKLAAVYQGMGEEFASSGLNLEDIKASQSWFRGLEGREKPWPKRYKNFPDPLPDGTVRLLVIPLVGSPDLAAAAETITKEALALLPLSTKVFSNPPSHYHCTVFHTSHPRDVRPSPFALDGGLASAKDAASLPDGMLVPTPATLAAENKTISKLVAAMSPPTLILDRVVMTASGTLVLTWVDPSGGVSELRQRMRLAFPGACTKQASIIHTTLLRVVSGKQLSPETIQGLMDLSSHWSRKLKGRLLQTPHCWWVHEEEFSTLAGVKVVMGYKGTSDL